jgi:agmatine deiminase
MPKESAKEKTPAALGFRMPAEWEKHEATWLGWPHNRHDWPGKIVPIHWVFGEMARKIAPGEIVRIVVQDATHEQQARRVLAKSRVDMNHVEFYRWPTDRGWTRDFGPICIRKSQVSSSKFQVTSKQKHNEVSSKFPLTPSPSPARGEGSVAVAKFKFTAWGYKYPNWQLDNQIAAKAAKALGLQLFPVESGGRPFALEGGGIDVNGRGTLLTTEECFQHPTVQIRNAGATKEDYARVFRDYLGATNTLWLGDGIVGDDTHGHVDDLCRFVNPTTVVMIQASDPADVNYRPLKENRARLDGLRLEDGSRLTVVDLPCPTPLHYGDWRLPASYANFYISNAAVIVPTFNDPADRQALGILADLFPGRTVTGIHAVDLVLGFGTLHCLTQQQPAAE